LLIAVTWPTTPGMRRDSVIAAPPEAAAFWLAPPSSRHSQIAEAVDAIGEGRAAYATSILTGAAREQELGGYARLYLGRAQLALNQLSDARASIAQLEAAAPTGYLAEAVLWLKADVAQAAENWADEVAVLTALADMKPLDPERTYLRLGRAALKSGDITQAIATLNRLVYEYPLSGEASQALADLAKLGIPMAPGSADEFARQLKRAHQLFSARLYGDARSAYAGLRGYAAGDEAVVVGTRIGACDYFLRRYGMARDELQPLAVSGQNAEAEFYFLNTLRGLGRDDDFVSRARRFVDEHPADPLAEEALNSLGTHYVLTNEDEKAAEIFAEMYSRFPSGAYANRAAWRAGWWKYKTGQFAETVRFFESAAAAFPRDDYRPMWLYWSARAHARLGQRDAAVAGYRQVIADYKNSYYGRQAVRALGTLAPAASQVELVRRPASPPVDPGQQPPNARIIQDLLRVGLYDTAILEVRKAQQQFGTSPLLDATIAYALNRKGDLRPAIIRMRRAYPQFIADGGELLPPDIRRVIFPVAYWDLITRSATDRKLDPYLMAALVAQESTFEPAVKSSAGAIGLMQIVPSTGRRYAAGLRIRPYSTSRLTQPDVNVRIGMATFADSVSKFGGVAPALAAYNAGDSRVDRWLAERRGMDQDEFVDDIPFPETQNYVKRILGTAEYYRDLYSNLSPAAVEQTAVRPASTKSSSVAPKASSASKKSPAAKKPATKHRAQTK